MRWAARPACAWCRPGRRASAGRVAGCRSSPAAACAPQKYNVHRVVTDLTQPWLMGYRRPLFGYQFWQYVDVDPARQPKAR